MAWPMSQINESTHPVRMKLETTNGSNPLTHKTFVISYGTQVSSVQVIHLDHLARRTTEKKTNTT